MVFQSALADIMLAAEVVVDAAGLRSGPDVRPYGKPTCCGRSAERCAHREAKDSTDRCLWRDDDFIAASNAKYEWCPRDNLDLATTAPNAL